jgi:hypothetical protein
VKPVTDDDIKRTLAEFYAALEVQGREGLFPIAIVFASGDGTRINVCTAEHIGAPGELLRNLAAGTGSTTRGSTRRAGADGGGH